MPMRASEVRRDASFEDDLKALRPKYAELDAVVTEFAEILVLGYDLPEIPVSKDIPHVYAMLLDYPPKAADGVQRFRVTYHATDPEPSGFVPYRTFTLLTITERS